MLGLSWWPSGCSFAAPNPRPKALKSKPYIHGPVGIVGLPSAPRDVLWWSKAPELLDSIMRFKGASAQNLGFVGASTEISVAPNPKPGTLDLRQQDYDESPKRQHAALMSLNPKP